ncbi:hypothetical protein PIB30_039421 [Stylosanthes scabra]|uniref:Uncharacterized protein n=1 Tax=Stylosanthes scabra TaxID=79078 RepID=A0ABU6SF99_9FABA|nr:hypothetical protein [Stylosanthes scabra]
MSSSMSPLAPWEKAKAMLTGLMNTSEKDSYSQTLRHTTSDHTHPLRSSLSLPITISPPAPPPFEDHCSFVIFLRHSVSPIRRNHRPCLVAAQIPNKIVPASVTLVLLVHPFLLVVLLDVTAYSSLVFVASSLPSPIVPSIFKEGVCCGSCFQIRCKDRNKIGLGLKPLVDYTDTTFSASSPPLAVLVTVLSGVRPQVLLLHPVWGGALHVSQEVESAREHWAKKRLGLLLGISLAL